MPAKRKYNQSHFMVPYDDIGELKWNEFDFIYYQ